MEDRIGGVRHVCAECVMCVLLVMCVVLNYGRAGLNQGSVSVMCDACGLMQVGP